LSRSIFAKNALSNSIIRRLKISWRKRRRKNLKKRRKNKKKKRRKINQIKKVVKKVMINEIISNI
jgi:hypothetical protein